ncbi:hypothetical protein HOG48_02410, partial [Candidatus Peregrinibacteria bacterium]|nr:hypothetical protein [Candidatus Peregrinibacteria bacterium]
FCGGVLSPKAIEKMLHDMKDSGSLIPASLLAIRTDLEKFVELYKGFGVECKVNKTKDGSEITLACEGSFSYEEYETASDKFDGYPGFHTDITFDNDGKFIEQGFWE